VEEIKVEELKVEEREVEELKVEELEVEQLEIEEQLVNKLEQVHKPRHLLRCSVALIYLPHLSRNQEKEGIRLSFHRQLRRYNKRRENVGQKSPQKKMIIALHQYYQDNHQKYHKEAVEVSLPQMKIKKSAEKLSKK
jgi:hypothetical protein